LAANFRTLFLLALAFAPGPARVPACSIRRARGPSRFGGHWKNPNACSSPGCGINADGDKDLEVLRKLTMPGRTKR
jgi:hypothetical protein